MKRVILERSSEYENKARKIKVFLDDKELFKIKDGEFKEFKIPTGKHIVYAKIDWGRSNKIEISGNENEPIKLFLQSGKGNLLYRTFINYKNYLSLERKRYYA